MAESGIYEIRCAVNGKRYVGSAVNVTKRWAQHRSQLRNGIHRNSHLQNAWLKHGEGSFVFRLIEVVEERAQLISREQAHLDRLVPEYNIARTAGSRLGTKQARATRRLISAGNAAAWESAERRTVGAERRTVGAEVLRKRWSDPKARTDFGLSFKKRWDDPAFRSKMIAAQKAVWDNPDFKGYKRLRGDGHPRIIKTEYSICHESGETLTGIPLRLREKAGLSSDSMSGLIRGRYKTAKGWHLVSS